MVEKYTIRETSVRFRALDVFYYLTFTWRFGMITHKISGSFIGLFLSSFLSYSCALEIDTGRWIPFPYYSLNEKHKHFPITSHILKRLKSKTKTKLSTHQIFPHCFETLKKQKQNKNMLKPKALKFLESTMTNENKESSIISPFISGARFSDSVNWNTIFPNYPKVFSLPLVLQQGHIPWKTSCQAWYERPQRIRLQKRCNLLTNFAVCYLLTTQRKCCLFKTHCKTLFTESEWNKWSHVPKR